MTPGDEGCYLKQDTWDIGKPAHLDCLELVFRSETGGTT